MQFESWAVLTEKEKEERASIDPAGLCDFGISVLDHALKRIIPNDLILIGADSGAGKSSIAIQIGAHNALKGKKVALFFLEGGQNEAIRRVKWKAICEEYYGNPQDFRVNMDYNNWIINSPEMARLKPIEEIAEKRLNDMFGENFFLYNITPDFSGNQRVGYDKIYEGLCDFFDGAEFGKIKFGLDLLIIDHLHYFDLEDGTRSTEAEKITKAMYRCKEISDLYKIPTVLISHLRKKVKDRGLPTQYDFHGSSSIPKISTNAIVICPAYDLQDNANRIYPTFFRFVKSRRGLKDNYAALVDYDLNQHKYADEYKIYPVRSDNSVPADELPGHKYPKWARKKADTVKDWYG